jgi:hypothetical protein
VLGLKPAQGYSPRDMVACHTWLAEKLNGPWPGGECGPRCGSATKVAPWPQARALGANQRGHHAQCTGGGTAPGEDTEA